jgi:UDP-N-acetylmuramate--alanine ligase
MGSGQIIAEVDESDGYIKDAQTDVSVVTNLRPDHLEHYANRFENLEYAVKRYSERSRDIIFLNGDDPILSQWAEEFPNSVTMGTSEKNDYFIKNRAMKDHMQSFDLYYKNKFVLNINLRLPGLHYAMDALVASSVALEYGIKTEDIIDGLYTYDTVDRRFNILYSNTDLFIIDDYAHTPDEIYSTIQATREYFSGRKLTVIFQPHRYTRLHRHFLEFVDVLKNADEVLIYRIYSAFEDPIDGVDERKVASLLNDKVKTSFYDNGDDLINELLKAQDQVLLFVGAGDITLISHKISKIISKRTAEVD